MKKVCYNLHDIDLKDRTNNLLLNMSGSLLPEHLSSDEITLLESRFGKNWFHELGYDEKDGYKNPT
jgi:hypothetical protein